MNIGIVTDNIEKSHTIGINTYELQYQNNRKIDQANVDYAKANDLYIPILQLGNCNFHNINENYLNFLKFTHALDFCCDNNIRTISIIPFKTKENQLIEIARNMTAQCVERASHYGKRVCIENTWNSFTSAEMFFNFACWLDVDICFDPVNAAKCGNIEDWRKKCPYPQIMHVKSGASIQWPVILKTFSPRFIMFENSPI